MRYFYFFVGAYVSVVSCLTLYVDKSCIAHGAPLDNALEEALLMARGAKTRLLSTTDTDFERVMERIFNFKRTDEKSLQKVIGILTFNRSMFLLVFNKCRCYELHWKFEI